MYIQNPTRSNKKNFDAKTLTNKTVTVQKTANRKRTVIKKMRVSEGVIRYGEKSCNIRALSASSKLLLPGTKAPAYD